MEDVMTRERRNDRGIVDRACVLERRWWSVLIGLSVVTAVLCTSFAAWSVPLSSRPTGTGPHYFGYFASGLRRFGFPSDGCQAGDYTPCVDDHANIVHIAAGDETDPNYCDPSGPKFCDTKFMLGEARDRGMGAVLDVGVAAVGNCNADGTLGPGWQTWWNSFKEEVVTPYQSTIVSFYIWDEPGQRGVDVDLLPNLQCIGTVAQQLKAEFPAIHRQVTFLARSLADDSWTIPGGVDWVGYDCYTPPPGSFEACSLGLQSVPYYWARLKSIVRKSNLGPVGLVLFPVGWQDVDHLHPDTSFDAQAAILTKVEREVALAENDPSFVMIMPFIWQSGNDGADKVGINALPMVRNYYRALGLHTTTANTPRLAFPSGGVGASSSYGVGLASNAFDYDVTTAWNSGTYAPDPFLIANFRDPVFVDHLSLVAAQSPAGQVQHTVTGRIDASHTVTLAPFSGWMTDLQQWLSGPISQPAVDGLWVSTQMSPSWIAWRSLDVWTMGSNRLYAYPISASGSAGAPEFISDADPGTAWNSGGFASASQPQFITLDLGKSQTVSKIELLVDQSPNGPTSHRILGGSALQSLSVLATSDDSTYNGEWLVFPGPFNNVRYLSISTTASPSWVAWSEINVYR